MGEGRIEMHWIGTVTMPRSLRWQLKLSGKQDDWIAGGQHVLRNHTMVATHRKSDTAV